MNFTFKLEPCIDHIKVSDEFEIGDLDLDLQGQIGPETSKNFGLNFFKNLTVSSFIFKLELFIDHLSVSYDFGN